MQNPREIRQHTAEVLQTLLACDGWKIYLKPALELILSTDLDKLADPSVKRADHESDDFLRGRISGVRATIHAPKNALNDLAAQEAREEQEARDQQDNPVGGPYTKTEDNPQE